MSQRTEYKKKYLSENYDNLRIVVPKGRRETIKAYAEKHGKSVNGLVNELLRKEIGITESKWKYGERDE